MVLIRRGFGHQDLYELIPLPFLKRKTTERFLKMTHRLEETLLLFASSDVNKKKSISLDSLQSYLSNDVLDSSYKPPEVKFSTSQNGTLSCKSAGMKKPCKRLRKKRTKEQIAKLRVLNDRQRFAVESMELDVNGLKQQIIDLIQTKHLLQSKLWFEKITNNTCTVKIAQEYLALFRHGVHTKSFDQKLTQEQFLVANMQPNICFNDIGRGIELFMEIWYQYSLLHRHLLFDISQLNFETISAHESSLELEELEEFEEFEENTIVTGHGYMYVEYDEAKILQIFPNLQGQNALIERLLETKVCYPCQLRIIFNSQRQMVMIDPVMDYVTAFYQVLKSLSLVNKVLKGSFLTQCLHDKVTNETNSVPYESLDPMDIDFLLN